MGLYNRYFFYYLFGVMIIMCSFICFFEHIIIFDHKKWLLGVKYLLIKLHVKIYCIPLRLPILVTIIKAGWILLNTIDLFFLNINVPSHSWINGNHCPTKLLLSITIVSGTYFICNALSILKRYQFIDVKEQNVKKNNSLSSFTDSTSSLNEVHSSLLLFSYKLFETNEIPIT